MAKDCSGNRMPFFKMWPRDFMADPEVQGLGWEERGRYVWALLCSWESESPGVAPVEQWSRWLGVELEGLTPYMPLFRRQDGALIQKRMAAEFEAVRAEKEMRTQCARNAAAVRWHSGRIPDAMRTVCQAEAEAEAKAEIETNTHTSPNGSASEFSLSSPPKREPPASKLRHRPPRGLDMPRTDKDWAETFAESFWPAYSEFKPGCSRAAAWKAWCAIPHPEGQSDWDAVWSAFEGYREKAPSEPRFRKDASTWLNDYHRNLLLETG